MMIGTGEPGIYLTNDRDIGVNPCCELSLLPYQFCNLTEIDAAHIDNEEQFYDRCRAAAFIATLQASYTDFHYLRSLWKKNTEKDALIGVGLTGLASNKITPEMMQKGALIVKTGNECVAKKIGIRKASRCTTLKPSGTTSILMHTSSGISPWYDRYYIRRIRLNKDCKIFNDLARVAPFLFEDDVIRVHDTIILSLPIKATDGDIIVRNTETALQFLERIKVAFTHWIKNGYTKGINMNNIAATCFIKQSEHESVIKWLYENRENYNGITVFPRDEYENKYHQLPYESLTEEWYNKLYTQLLTIQTDICSVLQEWAPTENDTIITEDGIAATEMNLSVEPSCSGDVCEYAH